MKKTLIALAVLAASGASIAQVTVTGNIGASYQKAPVIGFVGAGSVPENQGLFVHDGEVMFTATEALGTGWSVTARGGLTLRGRGGAVGTRDATVALTTPVGRITAGSVRTCGQLNTVLSGAVSGGHYSAQETSNLLPLDKCSLIDMANYSAPVGPVLVGLTYVEFQAPLSTLSGPGTPTTGAATGPGDLSGLTAAVISGTYNKGPLSITADYTSYSQRLIGQALPTGNGANASLINTLGGQGAVDALDGWDRTRIVGSYDFGMAKVGLGYEMKGKGVADQYVASVAVPMGAVTLGLDYTARDAQGKPSGAAAGVAARAVTYALGGRREGDKAWSSIGAGANYSFSKSTTLNVSYITYQDVGANSLFAPAGTVATAANTTVPAGLSALQTAQFLGGVTASNSVRGTTPSQLNDEYRIRLLKTF